MNEPNSGKGLQHAKRWVIELARCERRGMGFAVKMMGSVIREHFNTRTGTVYAGTPKLAELTGWHERDVKKRRSTLRHHGWLTDTGERRNRSIVWALTIPECDCGAHTTGVTVDDTPEPEPETDSGLPPEEEAEIAAEIAAEATEIPPEDEEQPSPREPDEQRAPEPKEPTGHTLGCDCDHCQFNRMMNDPSPVASGPSNAFDPFKDS